MRRHRSVHLSSLSFRSRTLLIWACAALLLLSSNYLCPTAAAQQSSGTQTPSLNPTQAQIEKERRRLSSSDKEERRDAVMRLGHMARPDASRAALVALQDGEPIVRATAARAVLSLPPDEAAAAL